MRTLTVLFLLVACEPPESTQPLSDPATAKADPRLSGRWAGHIDKADCLILLAPGKGATTDLLLVVQEKEKGVTTLHWQAFPTTIGGKTYLNLQRKTFPDRYAEKFELSPNYIFARYAVAKDGSLTLDMMQEDPVKDAVGKKLLEGAVDGDNVRLKAPTAKLAAFVEKTDPAKLWKSFGTFHPIKN